ncbi:polysaccharide deacetylase family protein [Chitinophaga sp.]|uniref:polysaccharide deacetylase family protein n=1 Tax=Chitinophaga sp. TaxID=1869181 RepID=UPI0031D1E8D5
MSLVKNAFYSAAQLFPLAVLKQRRPDSLLLPYHHLVSDTPVPHIKHLYPWKGTRAFEKDLDYLLRRFTPITLQDIIQSLRTGQALPAGSFLLTFDDGLREIKEIIAPMLLRKGAPAAFFLNSAFLDNKNLFYKFKLSLIIENLQTKNHSKATLDQLYTCLQTDEASLIPAIKKITYSNKGQADEVAGILGLSFAQYLTEVKPFLTLEEVGTLVQQGFAIGGHSIDHPYYSQLTLDEQLFQTRQSVDFLVQHFNLNYRAFAFPHTDAGVSRIFFNTLLEGPDPIDVIFGTGNHKKDFNPKILHRFNCERPSVSINAAVKGILLLNKIQQITNKDQISR